MSKKNEEFSIRRTRGIIIRRREYEKILMVVTSHGSLGDSGHETGLWMEEFTTPYYAFLDAGFEVTVASPAGGCVPIDPKSMQPENSSPSVCRFGEAGETVLGKTVRLADCRAADFVALFYPGGHGPMWDLARSGQRRVAGGVRRAG